MLYLYFSLYLYLYLDSGSRKRITLAEMRAFATFKSFSVPYGKAFFFFLQNNHRFFLAWLSAPLTPLAVGFFSHRRKIWHRPIPRVFIPTNHTRAVRHAIRR